MSEQMETEEIFKEVAFVPIDLPPFEFGDTIYKTFSAEMNYGWWEAVRLFAENPTFAAITEWSETAKKNYEPLMNYIVNFLPYDSFIHAKLMKAKVPAPPHLDFRFPEKHPEVYQMTQKYEPAAYRIVIHGSRRGKLFLCNKETSDPQNYIFPELPMDTDVYAMPYTNQYHGTFFEPDRLIVIVQGYLNPQKHLELLKKSLKRYKNYVIYKKDLV